jgi:hypothetical protein
MRAPLIALFALSLAACAQPAATGLTGTDAIYAANNTDVDLATVTDAAVQRLLARVRTPLDPSKPILVATLADVSNLKASSPFGRIVSEQIASSLVAQGYAVPEIKLRGSMLVSRDNGEFLLSRDIQALAPQHGAQAALVGTYAAGRTSVSISLRIVSLGDGMILGGYSYTLPVGANTDALLAAR